MLIGDLAKRAGVSIDTIRYYERQGLIAPKEVRNSGYREFDAAAPERLGFIRRAKRLGFSLRQISGLLSLKDNPDTTCADVKRLAEEKLRDTQQKIAALQEIERDLSALVKICPPARSTLDACPIIGALEKEK